MGRQRFLSLFLAVALWTGLLIAVTPPATAAPFVNVTVILEHIKALASTEEGLCGSPDWYAKVWINGQYHNNEDTPDQDALEGKPEIRPDGGWEFSVPNIDVATLATPGQIPLKIEVHDEDGGACGSDDHYDASPAVGRAIDGYVQLGDCSVHDPRQGANAFLGFCGSSITQAGTASDRAEVTFKVAAPDPTSAPGLRIQCTHGMPGSPPVSPVWPQDGQPVTITATALDGTMTPTVVADDLEIWVNPNPDINSSRAPSRSMTGAGSLTHAFTPDPAFGAFAYACRLREGDTTIFSGWHRVTVGDPYPNFAFPKPAVPILYTGPRSSRIDIVFIADRDSYTGANDPKFQSDLAQVINTSYYGFNEFLIAQDQFNFWVLTDNTGRADDANDGNCDHELPVLWDDVYSFADAGAILHRKNQRDCALRGDRIFSGVVNSSNPSAVRSDALQVITHETGHQPFGLADEYCSPVCDGGYFEQEVAPNVYEERDGCTDDAPALEALAATYRLESPRVVGGPRTCREWEKPTDWWADPDWSTSEPGNVTPGVANDDLMWDNGPAQAADIRRFDVIFAGCRAAGC